MTQRKMYKVVTLMKTLETMTKMKLENMTLRKKQIGTQQIDQNNKGINRNVSERNNMSIYPKDWYTFRHLYIYIQTLITLYLDYSYSCYPIFGHLFHLDLWTFVL